MSPRQAGPTPYRRTPLATKATQGAAVVELVLGQGRTFRQAATATGLSLTTCWRRYWFVMDWLRPGWHGRASGPIPPQRGTRTCPRGRPYLPTLDSQPDPKPARTKGPRT